MIYRTAFFACVLLNLVSCSHQQPIRLVVQSQVSERDYHARAFINAERIAVRDVDLSITAYFLANNFIAGSRHVQFVSSDVRLYDFDKWSDYRPLTNDLRQIVLPYEQIAPDDESAYVLPEPLPYTSSANRPTCIPTISGMRSVAISPILGRPLVGIWADNEGAMSIVTFPNEYRCDGPTVDRRYHVIPAGRTPWREIRLTPNLHLPPAVVMVSQAHVGAPIIYARVQFTAAAVTFDD